MKTRYVIALAILAALVGSLLSRPMWAVADRVTAGTYLLTFSDESGDAGDIGMLAMFTNTGQIITADRTDFGWMPDGTADVLEQNCGSPEDPVIQNAGGPQNNELQAPGFGSWGIRSANVVFLVMSYRYDENGDPVGFVRATGEGRPGSDGKIGGTSQLDFLPADADVLADEPTCSVDATFEGVRVPDELPKGNKGGNGGGDNGGGEKEID